MKPLQERLQKANSLLAPSAVPHEGTLGRSIDEPQDATRFPFQRDRGRIVHSQAFRRLQGKTQVFVAGKGDHFRSRLTHTMEVAQISRDVTRTLSLNEDLAECIALCHDLGHPPFGHMGEAALDAWMRTHGSSFEHNEQSLRIVTMLEEHSPLAPGLNLQREVLEGLQKHGTAEQRGGRGLSLEAQAVNACDAIAYLGHDTEDGLEAGLFSIEDLHAIPMTQHAIARSSGRNTSLRGALVSLFTEDLYRQSTATIRAEVIRSLDDVYASTTPLIGFSAEMETQMKALRVFLMERMYGHPRVREANVEGQRIIGSLCAKLFTEPSEKILALQERTKGTLAEATKDYVAGMTDGFAKRVLGEF